ncbi:hypothetical protein SAMN05216201_11153 [Pseudomonas linyingensis]|uniref:Uncharacterized protein n=2 Tax=Pseudomonas linyingensis TaxID=915471 RepID=A0A1H7A0S9_9PSED|nr:hypothetical protein SAMN05216201_11153 [Pseudomonas linyingensis]
MTPAKIAGLLQGQTSMARKLFEFVPIAEEWTEFQIANEMRRVTGSAPDLKVTRGCLRDLADSGLIRRRNDQFHRAQAQEKTKQKEAEMPAAKAVTTLQLKPTHPKGEKPADSPIEILGDIAGSIVALGKSMAEQLQQLASRVEEAAIHIEQGQEANAANLQKLKQLQSLLRSLGDDAA